MEEQGAFPGSKWWKVDFHVHTPASINEYKDPNATEEDILRAAMEAGIDCIVLTDHNSGGWIDRLIAKNIEFQNKEIKPIWYRDLVIFPGSEITVAESGSRVHLLAIFDINVNSETITSVLGECGIHSGFGDPQTSTIKGFFDVVDIIESADGIAVPAHIDGKNGLAYGAETLSIELGKSLERVYVAEFCSLDAFNNTDTQLKKAVERLAKIGGSDAHSLSDIGKHNSWIKMGKPSLTGLKLAFMDYEYCVNNHPDDPNHEPSLWISHLEIENMKYCGSIPLQPFSICLNPELNTLIGGRGSGKSTLIESLRIVMSRYKDLSSEMPNTKEKLDRFMFGKESAIQRKTEVSADLWRNGKQFRLKWQAESQESTLEEKTGDGYWQEAETGILQDRFPISIYSQKQIEELATKPRGLLSIIDKSKEVSRSEWNEKWEGAKSTLLQLQEKRRDLRRRISAEPEIRTKMLDLKNDLDQYEAKGHGAILNSYQSRIMQKSVLSSSDFLSAISISISDLASSLELPDFPEHLFDEDDETVPELQAIYSITNAELRKVSVGLDELTKTIKQVKKKMDKSMHSSEWYQSFQDVTSEYDKLVEEYKGKGSQLNLSVYGEWTQEYHRLQQQLQNIDSVKTELLDIEKQIDECNSLLLELRNELLGKRQHFITSVIGSNQYVRMELVQFGDVSTLEDDYRKILNIEGETFSTSIKGDSNRKGILWELQNWQDNNFAESELLKLVASIKDVTLSIASGEKAGYGHFDNRFRARLNDYYENQPLILDHLAAWYPDDMLIVKYLREPDSGNFDNIGSGSDGQKAAAILAFLLSYGNEPLIIDQPEDDLDNELIYDLIVTQLHKNKNRRQLIIATHNANIVVNGIAELVAALRFRKGQVRLDTVGSLGDYKVIDSICSIMEGGKPALEKRYKRMTLGGK